MRISEDIDEKKYDVVIVHPDQFTQAPFILRFSNSKTVYYCQEPYRLAYEYAMRINDLIPAINRFYENIIRYFIKVVDRKNVRFADFSIASCLYVRERMIESYDVFPKVFYPGIDTDIFKKEKEKRKNTILYIGSKTDPNEGYDLLEKALKLIPKAKRPTLTCVTWVKKNKERLSEKELVKMYSSSLLTACMVRLETFGLIPLESMACGTPVIATNVSGHRETIMDGKTGFLVDYDPQQIADKITTLLTDKKLWGEISENAERYIRKSWGVDDCNKKLISYITSIISA